MFANRRAFNVFFNCHLRRDRLVYNKLKQIFSLVNRQEESMFFEMKEDQLFLIGLQKILRQIKEKNLLSADHRYTLETPICEIDMHVDLCYLERQRSSTGTDYDCLHFMICRENHEFDKALMSNSFYNYFIKFHLYPQLVGANDVENRLAIHYFNLKNSELFTLKGHDLAAYRQGQYEMDIKSCIRGMELGVNLKSPQKLKCLNCKVYNKCQPPIFEGSKYVAS